MVAIEFGMCRSGRNGGSPGSVTVGYGKFREQRGATRSGGGNRLPFGDQESIGRDAKSGVMVEATPPPPFKMPEPDLLFELLIIALDTPAQLGGIDQVAEWDVFRQGREPIFGWRVLALRPLDQQPFFGGLARTFVTGCNAHTHARIVKIAIHSCLRAT
jgi:hypothetical protein